MEYGKIISITGLSGLFELLSSKADGAIVRSLEDKSSSFVSSRNHNFSHLESIEVYTQRDNVNLIDVFKIMKESSEPLPDEKDAKAVKSYFEKVYSEIDFDRVYASDMKKMVRWFKTLTANDVEFVITERSDENAGADMPQLNQNEKNPAPGARVANTKSKAAKVQAPRKMT